MTMYPQQTIHYLAFVKTAVVYGLRGVFENHPDENLRQAKVTLEFPTDSAHFPAVVVRFNERQIRNVGISHEELIDGTRYAHYWYAGELVFEVHALDPKTADYLSNTLVQTISVGYLETWTNQFFHQIYEMVESENPDTQYNSLTINSDVINPRGNGKEPAPWQSEDGFIYKNSYGVDCMGEYYSVPQNPGVDTIIESVNVYPYSTLFGETPPPGVDDPAPWITF